MDDSKVYIVFHRMPGSYNTDYLVDYDQHSGRSRWSADKQDAVRMTYQKAYRVCTKMNKSLDAGVCRRYGWDHENS